MGFYDVDSLLGNMEQKDKSKLLEIELNIIEDLNQLRKINNV